MIISERIGVDGPLKENLISTGTYTGDMTVLPPPLLAKDILLDFTPRVVQIVFQLSSGPNTSAQCAKIIAMNGEAPAGSLGPEWDAFFQFPTSAGFFADSLRINENGFSVSSFLNLNPSTGQVISDYFWYAEG